MKTQKIYKYGLESLRLARMNLQVQYEAEYRKVLEDCRGDVEGAELIMAIRRDPYLRGEESPAREKPELKLIKS